MSDTGDGDLNFMVPTHFRKNCQQDMRVGGMFLQWHFVVDHTQYVVSFYFYQDKDISSVDTVFKIPSVDKTKDNLNAALLFPSQSLACLSDGCGKLFLLQTESRTKDISQSTEWKVATVYQFNHPSLLLHALQSQQLITFSPVTCLSSGDVSYSSEMLQQFIGYSAPVYAAIEPGCTAVLVASERPFSLAKGNFFLIYLT